MKSYKLITILWAIGLVFASCNNPETKMMYQSGTAPVLTVSSTANLTLMPNANNAVLSSLQFQWTNPNYQFTNGVNTQSVTYTLQVDTVGSNFTNPNMGVITFTNAVSNNFTIKALNGLCGQLQLADGTPHTFAFRIKSTLANGSLPLYSNTVQITITTYLDVVYPVPANLYIVGDATPSGWQNDSSKPDATQTFTKVNPYTFQLNSIALTANQFLFIPVAGSWTHKYAFNAPSSSNNPMGDVFTPDASSNFQAPPAGNYKIIVNFKTAKYTMILLN
ncbi:MAG: SusE domain-containing protein [Bacteroidetes bacterium]|nr:SusE domain-containing protein [Bacteroidota bacterium]